MKEEIAIKFADGGLSVQDKYRGKHIALVDGKVVGWGTTVIEAFKMAQKKIPNIKPEKILLRFIPQENLLIL